jgi:hypothetical protein
MPEPPSSCSARRRPRSAPLLPPFSTASNSPRLGNTRAGFVVPRSDRRRRVRQHAAPPLIGVAAGVARVSPCRCFMVHRTRADEEVLEVVVSTPGGSPSVKIRPMRPFPCLCPADPWGHGAQLQWLESGLGARCRVHIAFPDPDFKDKDFQMFFQILLKCFQKS